MKRLIVISLAVLGLAGGGYYYFSSNGEGSENTLPAYEFSKVERKNILNMVSATGTMAARDIVEVGTQVSGILNQVLVDFNDEVVENQLIAEIDPSVLDAQVKIAQADLMRNQAQLQQAQNNLNRFKPVFEEGFLSDNDFEPYRINLQMAEASVLSSEANLDRANRNRGFAQIRAPISGVVIDRTVEPGQTVAASLSAPTLFTIANDLSKMEILANVDESDIGQIKVGQEVRFTVAAYLDDSFTGAVEEIRLLPDVVQNVVTYTVVVTADNPRGRLLPGMTATLDFVIEEVEDALSVPSTALNVRPNEEMMKIMQERRAQRMAERGNASGGEGGGQRQFSGGGPGGSGGGRRPNMAILWYLEDGKLNFMPVRRGVSDGVQAEVLPIRDLTIEEGMEVITKVATSGSGNTGNQSSGRPTGLRRLGF